MAAGLLKRALERPVAYVRVANDPRTYRELMRLRRDAGGSNAGAEVELAIGRLYGRSIWVREGTSDVDTVWDVFVNGLHVPPARVQRRGMHVVWDIGANIGLAMADMAMRWPEARIVGVEADPDNAALARRNFESWDDRCEVIEASVPELSLDYLLERTGGPVALARIAVPGARDLLREDTDWAQQVGCIKVDLDDGYALEDCVADLERLGFEARDDRRNPGVAVGVRPRE
jgi:FkbM family methyltransferase